jgi:hypothetical protein
LTTQGDDAEAAFLAAIRRSGIRIDRDGQLWHEGATVDHHGLRAALFRWLDMEGDHVVFRLDEKRFAYVEVEDTPLVARAARLEGERALLALSDGNEERLDPRTLTVDDAGVLRCRVHRGLEARLATSAAAALADRISGDPPVLRLGGVVAIPRREK